jgi:hypothetical protein
MQAHGNCIRRIVRCVSPQLRTSTGVVVKTVVKRKGQNAGVSDLVSDVNRLSGADSIATFIWMIAVVAGIGISRS